MRKYHAGFGREGACFLPEAIRTWQRTLTSVVNEVRDAGLKELFLNAARWSKDAEEVAKMRKHVLLLDGRLSRLEPSAQEA